MKISVGYWFRWTSLSFPLELPVTICLLRKKQQKSSAKIIYIKVTIYCQVCISGQSKFAS